MSDRRLKELEREALMGDLDAHQAWLREHLRSNSPDYLEAKQFADALLKDLKQIKRKLGRRSGKRPSLGLDDLLPIFEELVDEEKSWSTHELARAYHGSGPVEEVMGFEAPLAALAFGVRRKNEVIIGVALSESRRPSPGTAWPELSPWRLNASKETLQKKLQAFCSQERGRHHIPLFSLKLLCEIQKMEEVATDPKLRPKKDTANIKQLKLIEQLQQKLGLKKGEISSLTKTAASKLIDTLLDQSEQATGGKPASKKQIDFLGRLRRRRKLKMAEWRAFLKKQAGVEKATELTKHKASKIIDLLLNLDALEKVRKPPRKKRQKTANAKKTKKKTTKKTSKKKAAKKSRH